MQEVATAPTASQATVDQKSASAIDHGVSAIQASDEYTVGMSTTANAKMADTQGQEDKVPGRKARKANSLAQPRLMTRGMTDRPIASQKASFLKMRRNVTNLMPTTNQADHSSEDLSTTEATGSETPASEDERRTLNKKTKVNEAEDPDARFNDRFGKFAVGNDNFQTKGRVSTQDGRLNISVKEGEDRGYLARTLDASLSYRDPRKASDVAHGGGQGKQQLATKEAKRPGMSERLSTLTLTQSAADRKGFPPMNVVVMVIGSRGDIQPFLKIGKLLKSNYGHRVRIATHPAFKDFVEQDSGLEFFSVGGDPAELMAFMVKNPGLMPSLSTLKAGEVGRRRDAMFEMFQGFWRACINASDDETDPSNVKLMEEQHPFVADAIIANPPCFAHVHCAERLAIPLHLMFTFPYTPTQQFPHPLANIKKSNVDANHTNFMSYPLVEMM